MLENSYNPSEHSKTKNLKYIEDVIDNTLVGIRQCNTQPAHPDCDVVVTITVIVTDKRLNIEYSKSHKVRQPQFENGNYPQKQVGDIITGMVGPLG